jgi:hypothetical protein
MLLSLNHHHCPIDASHCSCIRVMLLQLQDGTVPVS